MIEECVLRVDNLSKYFKIYTNSWHRAYEWLNLGQRIYHQPFWALQDLSFEVRRGEFLGILGPNGAGKSTLLKILSGILSPTTGSYHITGKVLSMLGLGMDFKPYLSGQENAFRTAELLGFPVGYVQERIEQIVEFSELGEFFKHPVRLYSTGMLSRLAFSLFTFLECDVLILDEVLAVGDIFFKQKCYLRLEKLLEQGTTVLLVTHSITAIRQFCDKVMLLDKGRITYLGEPVVGIQNYLQLRGKRLAGVVASNPQDDVFFKSSPVNDKFYWPAAEQLRRPASNLETTHVRLVSFAVCNEKHELCLNFIQGEQAYLYCEFHLKQDIGIPVVGITLTNKFNVLIHAKNSLHYGIFSSPSGKAGEYVRFSRVITLGLATGEYVFGFTLAELNHTDATYLDDSDHDKFATKKNKLCYFDKVGVIRVLPLRGKFVKRTHVGLCDLPGSCQIQIFTE